MRRQKPLLAYVQIFQSKGRRYHYFRRPGHKRVRLPGLPGSTEYQEAYAVALADTPTIEIAADRTKAGSVSALIVSYYSSTQFNDLAAETKRTRHNIIERFRAEHGDKPVALLHQAAILKMLAKIGKAHPKRNFLKTIRALMQYAVAIGMHTKDPTDGIKTPRAGKSEGFVTWGEDHIAAFREHHAVGTRARLALELLLNMAARRSDIVRLGRQHVRNGVLRFRPQKTIRTTGIELTIPVLPELQAALDAMPEQLTFLVTAWGKAFTAPGFGNWFRDMCDAAGLHGFTAHGLRKAACRRLAEAGCSEKQIAAISGHTKLDEIVRYTEAADRARLARDAMAKLEQNKAEIVKLASPKLSNRR